MEPTTPHSMHQSVDVFDDEFAVDDYDFVADGFAPGRIVDDGQSRSSMAEDQEPTIRSVAAHMADMPVSSPSPLPRFRPSRNSIRKSRESQNPFRSAEDQEDGGSALGRTQSIRSQSTVAYAPGITHRSVSSTSSRAFAPSQTPFQTRNGPSHPYAMYPQGANLARTASVSTVSTLRAPSHPLMADQGPTHPYSMYPQNVSEDTESVISHDQADATSHSQTHIPVGFPGRNQTFHRQTGPEGEEQDIIGVDGHTEQLPPYSEYPETGVPKHIVLPNQAAVITPPDGDQLNLPLEPRRPQSMSDAGNRANPAAFASMEQMESNDSLNSMPKSWKEKSWKEKRKTKFCGIPFWWILLSLCVLAFIAIVLGGAIGGFMGSQKKAAKKHPQHLLPAPTSLFDASPIPTSSSGNPPPTGTYALSLGTAQATQAACLTDQAYNQAWDCNMGTSRNLAIAILDPPNTPSGWEGALLFDAASTSQPSNFSYGTQTPTTTYSQFIAVKDNDDPAQGPAFYFQAFYDKLVVIPASAIPPTSSTASPSSSSSSSSNQKRDYSHFSIPSAWHTRHQVAAGDKPWFCYWNSTFLEGFIYANNNNGSASSSSASSAATNLPTSPSSVQSGYSTSLSPVQSGYSITPSPVQSGYATSPTSTFTPIPSTSAYSPSASSNSNSKRDSNGGPSENLWNQLPQFEYLVKIEERRIPGSLAPYCQQMQILNDGTAGILSDENGPITVTLQEQDPGFGAYQSSSSSSSSSSSQPSSSSSRRKPKRDPVSGGCHCQWWSGAT